MNKGDDRTRWFPHWRPTISRLDFRPLAQLAPTSPRAPRTAPGPRPRAVTALDFDALQFYALLRVPVVKFNVVGVIAADAGHFSGIELALSFKISLDPVALARLLRALRAPAAAPRARAAARAAPVAPLLPRAAVGIGTRVEGFDVLGLKILIRISVVIPVWKSTSELAHPEHNCETFVNPHAIEQTQLRRIGAQ